MNELENIKSELSPFVGELRLVASAIAGDENAFSELYKRTYKGVYFITKKYLSNDEDIYEAMQETYFKVYVNLRFLREPENFYGWLKVIAQNTAIDILKSSKPDESIVDEDLTDDFVQAKNDLNIEIADIFKKLEPQYADILIKVYYDGLKVKEIAKLYKLPKSTVYSRLKTAESKLREMLEIRGIDGPLYGGDIASMLTLALRQIIGTDILKAAVMEEILQKVLKAEQGGKVVSVFAKRKRNAAVLRLASIIMVFVVVITAGTVAIINNFGDNTDDTKTSSDTTNSTTENIVSNSTVSTPENLGIESDTDNTDNSQIQSTVDNIQNPTVEEPEVKTIEDFGLMLYKEYVGYMDDVPTYALAIVFNDDKYATVYVSEEMIRTTGAGIYRFTIRATGEYKNAYVEREIVNYKIDNDGMITIENAVLSLKFETKDEQLILKECSSSQYEQFKSYKQGSVVSYDIKMEAH